MYTTNEDIRDGLLRRHVTLGDHEKAKRYVDNIIYEFKAPERIKDLPLTKELAVAFASYKRACKLWLKLGDMFHQKRGQHEKTVCRKTTAFIKLCRSLKVKN